MCKAKSFICVRGETKPRWSEKHDSHAKLMKELNLKDTDHLKRDFVKIEYFPSNDNWFDPQGFKIFIDEKESIPSWFDEEQQLWKDRCWEVIYKNVLPSISKGFFPGDLEIKKPVTSLLKKVEGYLYIDSNVTLPLLEQIGGYLYVDSSVTLPALAMIGAGLYLGSCAPIPEKEIKGDLYIKKIKFSAPRLINVNGKKIEMRFK